MFDYETHEWNRLVTESSFLKADHHVHSTFSDGTGSLRENLAAARRAGLEAIGFVDHVREGTRWLPSYTAAVHRVASGSDILVTCGVEAKILDLDGRLDLPEDLSGVDRIVAADHQVPGSSGPIEPGIVRLALRAGSLTASQVIEDVVTGTEAAMRRRAGLLLAHLFSILPKVGLSEDDVSAQQIERLAGAAIRSSAVLEVSERWRCPSERVVDSFRDAGVEIVASSDAHEPTAIGRYDYVARMSAAATGLTVARGAA